MGGLLVAIPQVHSLAEGPQIDRFGGPQASGAVIALKTIFNT